MSKFRYAQKHVIVAGSGHLAEKYIQATVADHRKRIYIKGYVGEQKADFPFAFLGTYTLLDKILESPDYDMLVIALDANEQSFMSCILHAAEKAGVYTEMVPPYGAYLPAHPTFSIVGDVRLINLSAKPLDRPFWSFTKRTVDIVGSLFLLILFSPIMLATMVGVRLSSPGPVIFRQKRVGKNRKPFVMYKFRSMRADTDPQGWTVAGDSRKTRFGRFIRKYSLDELPQLFNVLRGDMSLVGPRPEIPRYVRQFKEEVPLYLVRQQVRPGMTGWAQVHGLRGDTSIEARVKYDIWYIENWSLWLDIKILFRTAFGGMKNPEEDQKQPSEDKADSIVS